MNRFPQETAVAMLYQGGHKITPPWILTVVQDTEMQKTLSELFAAGNGQPVTVAGKVVVNMFRLPVTHGKNVRVRFVYGRDTPQQGLRLKIKDGAILINNQELQEVVVWKNTAPEDISFECRLKKKGSTSELRVWNCWLDSRGIAQAWIGNAGMIVEEAPDCITLHCSPGGGSFDPTALEVKLNLVDDGDAH